ncbi:MAG: hypothetical protein AAGD01_05215 [Acidobacteriota bacterium]
MFQRSFIASMPLVAFASVLFLALAFAPAAFAHTCGNQGTDNRPNHCYIKKGETKVHRASSCQVLEPGRCQYTHCGGSTVVIEEDDCCCLDFDGCPGASYVGRCLGISGKAPSKALAFLEEAPQDALQLISKADEGECTQSFFERLRASD